MAKVIGFFPSSACGARRLSVVGRLLRHLDGATQPPAQLNPEEWSDHMLRDIGLSDQRWAETLPSRRPWPLG
jgi:hypothetical protein